MAKVLGDRVRTRAELCARNIVCIFAAVVAPCAVARVADAQVFQTDAAKTPLPQPVGTAELNLCNSSFGYSATSQSPYDPSGAVVTPPLLYGQYYAPPAFPQFVDGDEITLAGLFKWRKEKIDPVLDAKTAPGHFFPGCGFTAELVLRGGACNIGLGWYNVTPGSSAPPADSEIHSLVPGNVSYFNAARNIFIPLAWDNRSPFSLSTVVWTPKSFSSGAIKSDPNYAGGEIAFALVGDPLGQCTQTKFSIYEHNVKNSSGVPWVTTLLYPSTVDPTGVYLAFEDLAMSPADWHQTGSTNSNSMNDGDFNDFVFFVSGLGATSDCPDPACATVKCSAGTTCSGGACVTSASGGASSGGASAGGSANGGSANTSSAGHSTGGAAMAGGGRSEPSNAGSAGDSEPSLTAGTGGSSESASGGDTTATAGSATAGSASGDSKATSSGCSCSVGSRGPGRSQLFALGLAAACLVRRRRRQP